MRQLPADPEPVVWIERWMSAAQKSAVIAGHLEAMRAGAADLEICVAVFSGRAAGLPREDLARFRWLCQPFRGLHGAGLPIETAGFVLPAIRARLGDAMRGAA